MQGVAAVTAGKQSKPNMVGSLLRGTGINFIGLIFRFTFIFLQSFLAVRLYGADIFGTYILAISVVNLLSYAGQLGFSRTVVRYVGIYIAREEWGKIVTILRFMLILTVFWSILLGITLSLATGFIENAFSEVKLANLLIVIGLAIPCLTLATLLAAFTQGFGVMQYKVITLDMLAPCLEVVLLMLFWWMGYIESGLMLSYTFALMIVCVFLSYIAFRFVRGAQQRVRNHSDERAIAIWPIMRFTFYAWLSLLLRHATRPLNILVIGALGTATMVGVYSVLERLVAVGVVFLMSINSMLAPIVSRLVEEQDYQQLGRIYMLSARWSLVICVPFFIVLAVFGEKILLLFGSEFVEGASALWWLSGVWIFSLLTGPSDVILMMSGRSHYSAINQIIMLLVMLILGWWLIPVWGLSGAVWAFSISAVVVNLLRVLQVQASLQINPFGFATAKVLIAGVVMTSMLLVLPDDWGAEIGWVKFLMAALVGISVYIAVLCALRLEREEVSVFNAMRKKFLLILA